MAHDKNERAEATGHARYVVLICVAAALGGLLFGYDTAVIAGAVGFLRAHFALSAAGMGWVTSSALVGSILGVSVAGVIADGVGRKKTLLLSAALFLASAVGTALPEAFATFVTFRILGGAGVGIASMTAPMYIAEVAPARIRGRMVSIYQLAIVIGIQVVYFANYFIAARGDAAWNEAAGWRWMFGSEALPALLFLGALFFVPETPRWLAGNGRKEKARNVLGRLVGEGRAPERMAEIEAALAQPRGGSLRQLLEPGLRVLLAVGVVMAVLSQAVGINAVIYYAPEIFKAMGADTDAAFLRTVAVGTVNLLFTFVAIGYVDRFGRKPLLIGGAAGMLLSHLVLGFAFFFDAVGGWTLIFVLSFIACFAGSFGPVTWVVLSEIFPNRIRGRAMSIATVCLWGTNFLVSQTFPMMVESDVLNRLFGGAFPFWLFAVFCAAGVVFVWRVVPETKEKSLEEIEALWGLDLEGAFAGDDGSVRASDQSVDVRP
jgi:sugar porter (SP) family MFS transporter